MVSCLCKGAWCEVTPLWSALDDWLADMVCAVYRYACAAAATVVWASVVASPCSLAVWACVAGNTIGDEGATSLSEALKCHCRLSELYLSRESFGRLVVWSFGRVRVQVVVWCEG